MTGNQERTHTRATTPAPRRRRAPTGAAADPFAARFGRLTAREVRLLVLVVKDHPSYHDIGTSLGISRANVATTMQHVRRKLAVPARMDLDAYIRSVPSLAALVEDDNAAEAVANTSDEQRRQDLLRITIDELQRVALRARRRASTLEALPVGMDEVEARKHEIDKVRRVADIVDDAVAEALRHARHR